DPHLAQVAALSVIRMNQLIEALEDPGAGGTPSKEARQKFIHAMARYTKVKEEHAELVKHEVRIIVGDFFKADNTPEGLFDLVNNIMKTASKARQNIDTAAATQLLDLVNQFAEAFWKAKGVATKKASSNQAAGGEYVVPAA
ncbi:MAG TPA: superoxide dismutase, Ni, partial [Dehalococcoidia bacterium]|nr:superoxide dismutase, Ni [Dehalococcoidia bacterium]